MTHVESVLSRAARGETVTTKDVAKAEELDREAARVAAIDSARQAAERDAKERAEIEELHSEAVRRRAAFLNAADELIAADAKVDAHMADVRAALAERGGAILKMQVADGAARQFDHTDIEAKARSNATLAKLHPGERPRVGLPVNVVPTRLHGAFLLDPVLREPVQFASLAERDAALLGRSVPGR